MKPYKPLFNTETVAGMGDPLRLKVLLYTGMIVRMNSNNPYDAPWFNPTMKQLVALEEEIFEALRAHNLEASKQWANRNVVDILSVDIQEMDKLFRGRVLK